MAFGDTHYSWEVTLNGTPEQLWPLVTDTNRFDRDAGTPALAEKYYLSPTDDQPTNARLFGKLYLYGVPLAYVQEPFEWFYPHRFGVVRNYTTGPLARLRVQGDLLPLGNNRTRLIYQVWLRPANILGVFGIPVQGLIFRTSFLGTFRKYADFAAPEQRVLSTAAGRVKLAPKARERIDGLRSTLTNAGYSGELVDRLIRFIQTADDVVAAEIRPYALADLWQVPRRQVLTLCLAATRAGLLDTRWRVMCPLCRNDRGGAEKLRDIRKQVHCDTCNIDFSANFEQSVELVFRPNPAIRVAEIGDFCIDHPGQTPHVMAQQLLTPGETRTLNPVLEPGRYRIRTLAMPGGQYVLVRSGSPKIVTLTAHGLWPDTTIDCSPAPTLSFENATTEEQLFIFERLAYTDQATTAAEVTTLQTFRDLFADDVLRPGEEVSVGSLAVAFTDLRDSTSMYQQVGDATAFGQVMSHFDVLRDAIVADDGAIVKTIGDSVMAIFRDPAAAVRALLHAQAVLANPVPPRQPLALKIGLHYGPSIAVTLNERLDYFGSTVNIAARLESLSTAQDLIITEVVYREPSVQALLNDPRSGYQAEPLTARLKGFGAQDFQLWRISQRSGSSFRRTPPESAGQQASFRL